LAKRECTNATHKHTIPYFSLSKVITTYVYVYKRGSKKVLQKIEHVFNGSDYVLTSRLFTLP
jgi:hypothetical protein